MNHTTPTRAQSEHDMHRIAAMYLAGKPQHAIAEDMGCTQQNISRKLRLLRERWLNSALRDFDDLKSEQLAKIDRLESEYWEAWERSKRPRTKKAKKEKQASGPSGDSAESSVVIEERDGNPSWLAGVERCIERRCKLLGLDAPVKHSVSTQRHDLSALSDDELMTWQSLMAKATAE